MESFKRESMMGLQVKWEDSRSDVELRWQSQWYREQKAKEALFRVDPEYVIEDEIVCKYRKLASSRPFTRKSARAVERAQSRGNEAEIEKAQSDFDRAMTQEFGDAESVFQRLHDEVFVEHPEWRRYLNKSAS